MDNSNLNTNPELLLANDFVCHTDHNIFLTGKAGTGKTTFLQSLKTHISKRLIITAPTGVAAINAGGVTLHSFFQIPFGPFVPGIEAQDQSRKHRFNKEKINIIKTLDLLIIDEISMVRCDVLDAIDAVLRRYRRSQAPFGGVQLLMIGDLHQLPPVVKHDEWSLLQDHYDSAYFFSSRALNKTQFHCIELQHIYRQSDPHFIELLNRVRENRLDDKSLQALNSRYQPDFKMEKETEYITLTSHNRNADSINQQHLHDLAEKSFTFNADIEGNYPEYNYPTAEKLILKEGAQVMFVRNDVSQEKLYFNGKIGRISEINEHFIQVKCPADDHQTGRETFHEIRVEKVSWENIKYTINQQDKEISEEIIGKFSQYPLRLAWAITIHKSQGLTFEHAVIDANAAFSHGQVYVALSRCKTFEGMVLSTPISHSAVKTDDTVSRFMHHASHNIPTAEQLNAAKVSYQEKLISDCFEFQTIRSNFYFLNKLLRDNQHLIQVLTKSSVSDGMNSGGMDHGMEDIEVQVQQEVFKVSDKFKHQLHSIIEKIQTSGTKLPEDDTYLQERISKASAYFLENLQKKLTPWAFSLQIESDNKELRKRINKSIEFLQQSLVLKLACLESCRECFSSTAYLRALATAEIDFKAQNTRKKQTLDYSTADIEHPELFAQLKNWRSEQAKQEDVAHFQVLHQRVMIQIVIILPDSLSVLKNIKGVGKRTIEKYGAQIIAIIADFCQKNNIQPNKLPPAPLLESSNSNKKATQEQNGDTKQVSYELYKAGKSIAEIAQQRGLVNSTIENHLAFYIGLGKLDILDLLSVEKLAIIKQKISALKTESLKEIKAALGDDYSYAEIRMVKESLKND